MLDASFKLDDLLKLELHKFADEVGEIVDCAQKEEKMEQGLAKLKVIVCQSCAVSLPVHHALCLQSLILGMGEGLAGILSVKSLNRLMLSCNVRTITGLQQLWLAYLCYCSQTTVRGMQPNKHACSAGHLEPC